MTIRHIVFDIGRVLIHYDPHLGFLDLLPDEAERTRFLATVCTSDWNMEQDRGRGWAEAEELLIAAHPDQAHLIRAFRANWHRMVSHAYEDSVRILRALLAAGADVTLLTNFASDTFRQAQRMFPFLTETRGVTVSGDVRLIKPDPRIYDLHARLFELEPGATLFIDDSPANIESARNCGWHGIVFTNAEALKADLERFELQNRDWKPFL